MTVTPDAAGSSPVDPANVFGSGQNRDNLAEKRHGVSSSTPVEAVDPDSSSSPPNLCGSSSSSRSSSVASAEHCVPEYHPNVDAVGQQPARALVSEVVPPQVDASQLFCSLRLLTIKASCLRLRVRRDRAPLMYQSACAQPVALPLYPGQTTFC